MRVCIVLKEDQRSGKLTEGIVKDILTRSPTHPHGIKVRLDSGQVGRVKFHATEWKTDEKTRPLRRGGQGPSEKAAKRRSARIAHTGDN